MKKGWKIVLIVLSSILLLILLSVGFTQTKIFRNWLRGYLLAMVHENTNGVLYLGDFSGSLFTGLSIEGVSLSLHGEEIFTASHLELRYNPLELFQKHIALGRLHVVHPRLTVTRNRAGKWNLDDLLKTKDQPSRPLSPLPWVVELKALEVSDGEFILEDSTFITELRSAGSVSVFRENPYGHVELKRIDGKVSAALSWEKIQVSVNHLKFDSPTFGTNLENFSATLEYSPRKLSLQNLTLRTTGSSLTASAEVDSLRLGEAVESRTFKNRRARVAINASQINLGELRQFIPDSPEFKGSVHLSLQGSGTLGDLRLEQFVLQTRNSELKLSGQIQNLFDSENRRLDLTIGASSLDLSQIPVLFPSAKLPRTEHLNSAQLEGSFRGNFKKFEAQLTADLKRVGKIVVAGSLDVSTRTPEYQARIMARNFNLGALLNDQRLEGKINTSSDIAGKGFDLDNLDVMATIAVDSSEISKVPLDKFNVAMSIKEKHARGDISITSRKSAISFNGAVDFGIRSEPKYSLQGRFSSVDLSKVLLDERRTSNLSGTFDLHASGDDLDKVSGDLDLRFEESDFRGHQFEGAGIKISMDQRHHNFKSVAVESPIANIRVEGDFHLKPFLSLTGYQAENILRSLKERFPFIDTARATFLGARSGIRKSARAPLQVPEKEYLNFTYDVELKSLTPVSLYFGDEEFDAKGTVKGFVVGDVEDLLLGAKGEIENFLFRGAETRVFLAQATIDLEADHLKQENVLDALACKLDVKASTFVLNSLRTGNLRASVDYLNGKGSFDVAGTIDSTLTVESNGSVEVSSGGYLWRLDNLTLDYRGYVWFNNMPFFATVDTAGLTLTDFEMVHRGERFVLKGGIRPNRELSFSYSLRDFQLSNLYYFLPYEEERRMGGFVVAEGTLAGLKENPSFTLKANSRNLEYGGVPFGDFQAEVRYVEKRAALKLEFHSSSPKGEEASFPSLRIAGSFPIDLAFMKVDDRLPDGPLDIQVEAAEFRLDLLDPFIPVFDEIGGRLSAAVHFGGRMKSPESSGTMQIDGGTFVFAPNSIRYYFSGDLEPRGDKIFISKLLVRNDPLEAEEASLRIGGQMTLKKLSIESFDVNAQGSVLILKETAKKSTTTPYGNVVIGIGGNGLRYYGTVERSWLTGSVGIKTMALTFPPVALLATTTSTSSFTYTVIDDTSKPIAADEGKDSRFDLFFSDEDRRTRGSESSEGFLDRLLSGMRADVSIETQGPAQLRMIFTYSTGEELFSELRGKLFLTKDEFGTRFIGDVDVSQRSYYYFYKRFDATGELKFTGALDNPEMDIVATYEGFRTRPSSDTVGVTLSQRSKQQRVVVTLKIKGTRVTPILTIEMTVDGNDWPGDVQSDAIAFIISGKFRDDLTTTERSQIATNLGASVTSTLITGVTSSLFSGLLTDFLRREFGSFIRQAELSYSGGSVSETADLRLTGEIGQTVIRVGGRVFNDIGNANVSVQMPVGRIVGAPALEDLIIELERKVEGSNFATDEKKLTNGARVYYRITF